MSTIRTRERTNVFRAFLISGSISLMLFLPWMVWDWWYESHFRSGLLGTPFEFASPKLVNFLSAILLFDHDNPMINLNWARPTFWVIRISWIIVVSVIALTILKLAKKDVSREVDYCFLLTLILSGGVFVVLILDYVASYFFVPRQLLIFTPHFLLLLCFGVVTLCRNLPRIIPLKQASNVALLIVPAFMTFGYLRPIRDVHFDPGGRHRWREVANYLSQTPLDSKRVYIQYKNYLQFYASELAPKLKSMSSMPLSNDGIIEGSWIFITSEESLPKDIRNWLDNHRSKLVNLSVDDRMALYYFSSQKNKLIDEIIKNPKLISPFSLPYSTIIEEIFKRNPQVAQELVSEALQGKTLLPYDKVKLGTRFASILSNAGFQNDAVGIMRQVLSIVPGHPDAWFWLGKSLILNGDANEGIYAYKKAISLYPYHYRANRSLAEIVSHQEKTNWDYFILLNKNAVKGSPDLSQKSNPWLSIAQAYVAKGDLGAACYAYRQSANSGSSEAERHHIIEKANEIGCDIKRDT